MRSFTTDGPCDVTHHYVLPAPPRLAEARSLIDQGVYFVLHAPGRTGKTTAFRALAAQITAEGRYAALVCSAAVAAPARMDIVLVQDALLSSIRIAAEQDLPFDLRPPPFPPSADATRLWEGLSAWARVCPRPLVLFFDDLDSLHGAALESVFRQLETGFSRRPAHFPWSIGLAGQFDVRSNGSSEEKPSKPTISTGPFERFWSSRLLPSFTIGEIRALYAEHFGRADGRFTSDALAFILEASAGHPFFVQAIGHEIAQMVSDSEPITKPVVFAAYQRIVKSQITPIDDFASVLMQPRVRRVVEPLLQGNAEIASIASSDLQFVRDLGLVSFDDPVRIDGLIFRALAARLLSESTQRVFQSDSALFFDTDGRLSIERLLQTFIEFYAAHAAELVAAITYSKIAPELVFLGVLLRALEGRGWVDVEFGVSRGRIDVTLSVPIAANHLDANVETNVTEQREVLVFVTRRKGDSKVKTRGLAWLDAAMLQTSSDSGTLVIFDKRDKRSLAKRVNLRQTTTAAGTTVRLLRV